MDAYPLLFSPLLKPRIWGGRRLATLGKSLPAEGGIGESWEIADLEDDQSVVRNGPAAGATLSSLVADWGPDLLGPALPVSGRFPLLIKFLDAEQILSVQVHPNRAMAKALGGAVRIKNEAWYVIECEPEAFIYYGLQPGMDRAALRAAIEGDRVEEVLRRVPVKPGQCYYLPSGMVHALGAGVLVAEVQTPSDTTYRIYDWNRVDAATGKPRTLHIEQALQCIDFESAIPPQQRSHVGSMWTTVSRLVTSESFLIERVRMVEGFNQDIPYDGMVVWIVLEGSGRIEWSGGRQHLDFARGDTVLLPAGCKDSRVDIRQDCLWLEVTLPLASDLAEFERPSSDEIRAPDASGMVQLNFPGLTGSGPGIKEDS
jgi:mannose-6-phosphate isomerase